MSEQTTTEPFAGIGDNLPPTDEEILGQTLEDQNKDRLARFDALMKGVDKMPKVIENEETAQKCTTFLSQLTKHRAECEKARKTGKAPYIAASKVLQEFFTGRLIDPLDRAIKQAKGPVAIYIRKKEDAEKARKKAEQEAAEAEARAAREAEDKAEAENRAFAQAEAAERAEAAEKVAEKARKKAAAPAGPAVRSETGGTASTTTTWGYEIEDVAQIPLEMIRQWIPAAAIEAGVRGFVHSGGRILSGVTIKEETKVNVR